MGAALAVRLAPSFEVVGFDPLADRRRIAAGAGVRTTESVEEVASATEVILLSLPHPSVSHTTVERILARWSAPGLIVETSTVTPDDARADGERCRAAGHRYVEAAILSGVAGVQDGTTTLLVGGSVDGLDSARPVLERITPNLRHLGDVGAGAAAKVINNAVAHAVYVVLAEAAAMGEANGLRLDTLVGLLQQPDGGLIRPLTHRIAERFAHRDFAGGMRVDSARKDSELALQLAQSGGVPLFAIQAAHTVYEIAVRRGMSAQDYSVIATLWDR
jgi:3-hydroxyisobutyrate dehydrogenase-like beta-hydroxyacid dehydrogenase